MVAPDLQLYDELTGIENLRFFSSMSGCHLSAERASYLLTSVGLMGRGNDFYGEYSSGMKARLKLAVAVAADPEILLLDEPTANLDEAGRAIVHSVIEHRRNRGIVIFATNDQSEFQLGGQVVRLG
jgi:heme exporter protein A